VITDEQHRFGVNQRQRLREKGAMTNVLFMTATPIPRTLKHVSQLNNQSFHFQVVLIKYDAFYLLLNLLIKVVAAICMYALKTAGYQSALMVPTEILFH
jgi:RecG-like helicase